jgi:hypothetical protein
MSRRVTCGRARIARTAATALSRKRIAAMSHAMVTT